LPFLARRNSGTAILDLRKVIPGPVFVLPKIASATAKLSPQIL
jgi:hypothetical protein